MKRFDYTLVFLQLAVLTTAVLATVAMVRLFHHQTDDYAVPFLGYLASIRLAFPPILALIGSYILVFIGGARFADTPKLVISFLRNNFFQNRLSMATVSGVLLLLAGSVFWHTSVNAPPSYERLIAILLGGEQDRQKIFAEELQLLEERNEDLARRLGLAGDVFLERARWNFRHEGQNTTTPRIFVRALSSNILSEDWKQHPLRKLALAEAYSMWAQAVFASPLRPKDDNRWSEYVDRSLSIYAEVHDSGNVLATELVRYSALNNSGNALLYVGRFAEAAGFYERVLKTRQNLSSAGNLVAAYILLNELEKAVLLGESEREQGMETGRALTETSAFSGVLVNLGLAHMIKEDYDRSSDVLLEAYDLEPDNLNALNLAVSLTLQKQIEMAEFVLQDFRYPDLELDQQQARVNDEFNACYYLVRALAIPAMDHAAIAAHLYTYLRIARTRQQLEGEDGESLRALRKRVLSALQQDATPCRDLHRLPGVRNLLDGR